MMNGQAFVTLAGKLSVFTTGEPEWRTSVSRAYFGAYHHAREFLSSKLKIVCIKNSDAHDQVYKALDFSGHTELRAAARALNTLRSMRNAADYDLHLDAPGEQLKAKTAVALAFQIVTALDAVTAIERGAAQMAIKTKLQWLSGLRVESDLI